MANSKNKFAISTGCNVWYETNIDENNTKNIAGRYVLFSIKIYLKLILINIYDCTIIKISEKIIFDLG
jgi:hypothetical protein